MAGTDSPKSSLRNNIMIAFVLGVVLFGGSITVMSHRVLDHALAQSGLPTESTDSIGRDFTRTVTGFLIACMAVALVVAAFLSRTITEPIHRLLAGVREITEGNLDVRIDISGGDELGRLADAFNGMAGKLQQSHENLEATVQQRTTELTDANRKLEEEVAERARAEHAIRESEQCLKTIFDSFAAATISIDRETHLIHDVNPAAEELIGVPRHEIIGRPCQNFICPNEKGACPVTDRGRIVKKKECVLLKADGTAVPVLKSVARGTLQDREYLIESVLEITDLKKAEAELKASLSLLEATLESTADGILVTDRAGVIKHYNKQFAGISDVPEHVFESGEDGDALSLMLERVKDPDSFFARVKELEAISEEDSFDILEYKTGQIVECYSKPHVIDGRIVGRVWSIRDVTETRNAQLEQDRLLHQVARINEELSHFAYVVSHDLKAPLRGIKLITEWLRDDYGDQLDDDATAQMDLLKSRVQRMHNLIEGVLQYSRVGRIQEDRTTVDLNEMIATVIDTIAPPEHVNITVEGSLPEIKGEKTRMTQVFQNLIDNAVKYMDKPQGQVTIGCSEDEDMWTFRVTDNGPGIEEKYFERIFKIFQTLTARDAFESTGIGLTLVKKIVELYGGAVWVESKVGHGSTFFFTFPKHNAEIHNKPAPIGAGSCDEYLSETVVNR